MSESVVVGILSSLGAFLGTFASFALTRMDRKWDDKKKTCSFFCDQLVAFHEAEEQYISIICQLRQEAGLKKKISHDAVLKEVRAIIRNSGRKIEYKPSDDYRLRKDLGISN